MSSRNNRQTLAQPVKWLIYNHAKEIYTWNMPHIGNDKVFEIFNNGANYVRFNHEKPKIKNINLDWANDQFLSMWKLSYHKHYFRIDTENFFVSFELWDGYLKAFIVIKARPNIAELESILNHTRYWMESIVDMLAMPIEIHYTEVYIIG